MAAGPRKNSFIGYLAGVVSSIFGNRKIKPDVKNIREAEFPASTQRMGVRFTEKIRNIFRFKWIK